MLSDEVDIDSNLSSDKFLNDSIDGYSKEPPRRHKGFKICGSHLIVERGTKLTFDPPYEYAQSWQIMIRNNSSHRIAWACQITYSQRLDLSPGSGVLDPMETKFIDVSCDSFDYDQEDTRNDYITVQWTNTPDGAAKQFRREWFHGPVTIQSMRVPIVYNP